MRISDWSSDMCSSDLAVLVQGPDAILDDVPVFSRSIPRPVEGNGVRGKHPLLRAEREKAEPCIADIDEIGRASCRERVCQCVWISEVAVSLKTKHITCSRRTSHQ